MNVASVNRRKYEAIKEKQNAIYAKEQRQREVVQQPKTKPHKNITKPTPNAVMH